MADVNLNQIFLNLQRQMIQKLSSDREIIFHPTAKGDASEINWIEWLKTYLPRRYEVDKAFVIDSNNNFLVFGPQMQYVKNPETGEWVKSGLGFKRSGGVHYIDINSDGINDFYTNIPI